MRTHFGRLLDFIKASAALYQFQRERDSDGYILAQPEDYNRAIIPLNATTSNPMMIPLNKKQKMLLEECNKLKDFSVKQLEPHVPFLVQSKLYDALAKLQELGFLTSYLNEYVDSKKPVRYYKPVDFQLSTIPDMGKHSRLQKKGKWGKRGK